MSTKRGKQGTKNYSKYCCFENPCTGKVHKNLDRIFVFARKKKLNYLLV